MIKASIARRLIANHENIDAYNEQLEIVNRAIEKGIEIRQDSVIIEHILLMKAVKKTLRSNGYKVEEFCDEYTGRYTIIRFKRFF